MRQNPPLDVVILSSADLDTQLHRELLSLCSRAYEEDFSSYLQLLSPAMHMLARLNGELVSHVAWIERELRASDIGALRMAYIEAVATAPEHQGRGYATALLSKIPALVGDFALAALSPVNADYYRRLGWELWQGPLSYIAPDGTEIPTPEEQLMIHRLPLTPAALDLRAGLSVDWRPLEVW